jgi:hypothetical protein
MYMFGKASKYVLNRKFHFSEVHKVKKQKTPINATKQKELASTTATRVIH